MLTHLKKNNRRWRKPLGYKFLENLFLAFYLNEWALRTQSSNRIMSWLALFKYTLLHYFFYPRILTYLGFYIISMFNNVLSRYRVEAILLFIFNHFLKTVKPSIFVRDLMTDNKKSMLLSWVLFFFSFFFFSYTMICFFFLSIKFMEVFPYRFIFWDLIYLFFRRLT